MSEAERAITALLQLMARLRDPVNGCPWDCEQTFATIAPYTIEEAYEVADAIDRADPLQLRDELGDLLFQIVFHARMAEERGWFDFASVASSIHAKLVRRHPHVFAGAAWEGLEAQTRKWEDLKARERAARPAHANDATAQLPHANHAMAQPAKGATHASHGLPGGQPRSGVSARGARAQLPAPFAGENEADVRKSAAGCDACVARVAPPGTPVIAGERANARADGDFFQLTSALADVPKALPALARAAKLGRRAARVGFDWQEPSQVRDKVLEELSEVDAALAAANSAPEEGKGTVNGDASGTSRVAEELGDLLFAIANWTLHLKIDPEEALRAANAKFERRFRHMESLAHSRGAKLESLTAAEWDELWRKAKAK